MNVKEKISSLGITSETYKEIALNRELNPTQEQVDFLSPDNIDSGEFWEAIAMFEGAIFGTFERKSIEEINYWDRILAWESGVMSPIFRNPQRVLEIGPGYGPLFPDFVNKVPEYFAIDVFPRHPMVFQTDGWSIPGQNYDWIIASNVFQHLSKKQRENYIRLAYDKLTKGGALSFNIHTANDKSKYVYHYGQYTELHTMQELSQFMTDTGFVLYSSAHNYTNQLHGLVFVKGDIVKP